MSEFEPTATTPEASAQPVEQMLPGFAPELAPSPARRLRKRLLIGGGAAAALLVAGAAFAAVNLLSGGGAQPESVLPGSTIAFAKLDLDPAANQKISFVQFISKLSGTFKQVDEQDPLKSVYSSLDNGGSAWSEIRPWLGDRYAVAAVPAGKTVAPVLVLEVTDEQAMRAYMAKQAPETHIAMSEGFALIAEQQSTLDAIANSKTTLSDNGDFKADVSALPGDQVAVVWADLKQVAKYGSDATALLGDTGASAQSALESVSGRIAMGLHFTADSVVLAMVGRGTSVSGQSISAAAATEEVHNLPADALAGLSLAGIGDNIRKALADDPTIAGSLTDMGLRPADLVSMFSGPVTLAALTSNDGSPNLVLSLTPKNAAETKAALRRLLGPLFGSLPFVSKDGHLYAGLDAAMLKQAVTQLSSSSQRLSDTEVFSRAVPSSGAFVLYINGTKAMPLLGATGDALKLGAIGMVARAEGKSGSSATLTVTLK